MCVHVCTCATADLYNHLVLMAAQIKQIYVSSCLTSYLFSLSLSFSCVTSEEYYIVPSQSYPYKVDCCPLFRQFVSSFTNCSKCSNTTLIFVPLNHRLESDLIVEDVHSFSMFAEPFCCDILLYVNLTCIYVNVYMYYCYWLTCMCVLYYCDHGMSSLYIYTDMLDSLILVC